MNPQPDFLPGGWRAVHPVTPRLRMVFGIWVCVTRGPLRMGHGYTPQQAYLDWLMDSTGGT